ANMADSSGVLRALAGSALVAAAAVACGTHGSNVTIRTDATSPASVVSATPSSSPGYAGAAKEWRAGASAASYQQGVYWSRGALDLARGLDTDARASTLTGRSAYTRAITALRALASLPDTGDTPAQQAEAQRDVRLLDAFFGTPGLYS